VKKIEVEILMNLHVLRSQESEKVFFFLISCVLCSLYSVTVAGDESTSRIKMKLWKWDKTRTEMRFFGVLFNKRSNGG